MPNEPTILLSPKARFCANPAVASSHSDLMASPTFQTAASTALLQYQLETLGGTDPQVLAVVAAKLKGAQEVMRVLLNLGRKEVPTVSTDDNQLIPPEETIDEALGRRKRPQP